VRFLSEPSRRLVNDTGWETLYSLFYEVDMNGPDIEAVDEVKVVILESVNMG
jgi:hypothetical protein